MAKVTSKLQVTIPKSLADQFGIKPGTELNWIPAGDSIRVVLAPKEPVAADAELRLQLFDEATARQRRRERAAGTRKRPMDRGWTRQDLYRSGRSR